MKILKKPLPRLKPTRKTPHRFFGTCNLACRDRRALEDTYYDPFDFYGGKWCAADSARCRADTDILNKSPRDTE